MNSDFLLLTSNFKNSGYIVNMLFITTIPKIFGQPVNVWEGILLLFLVTFQVLVGKGWLKVNFKWHRWNGLLIFLVVLIHAYYGIGMFFFGSPVKPL